MKLYKVIASLTGNGWDIKVQEWEAVEKVKTYHATRTDEWNWTEKKQVKKERLHTIESTSIYNSNRFVAYKAWCFADEIEEWKEACKNSVIRTIRALKTDLDNLVKHIPELKKQQNEKE